MISIKVCTLAFVLAILSLLGSPLSNTSDGTYGDVEVLRSRMISDILINQSFIPRTRRYTPTDFRMASKYQQSMDGDGGWSDVDYLDTDNFWDPLQALDRILVMSYAFHNKSDDLYQDRVLLTDISRAIQYWYEVNPTCRNWYKNDIAKQIYFNVIALLMQDHISQELMQKMTNDLTLEPSMTGSNRTLLSVSVLYRGVIEKDPQLIRDGVAGIMQQVKVTTVEGIQPDYSFHQHGAFLYNGSYGHNFLRETIWLASLVRDTRFAFGNEAIGVLRRYYLDGTRWMIWRGTLDYNTRGRRVGRKNGFKLDGDSQLTVLDDLIKADPASAEAYSTSKKRIISSLPQEVEGHRHFWRSDYTVQYAQHYFTSLKMCSERTIGMEMDVNTENLYGYYLPFGLTYIYQRGDEYVGIFPAWDWARLPGVTSPHQAFPSKGKITQQTTFVGGVSDGTYGISVMDLQISDTEAKKSWFWFGDRWVALGAGISSTHTANIVTGVNQCHLHGPVYLDGVSLKDSSQVVDKEAWIWHDSIAYLMLQGSKIHVQTKEQVGNLNKIYGLGKDTIYRPQVFSLWFDHGVKPEGEEYAYMVIPGLGVDELKGPMNDAIEIIDNSNALQAIYHKGLGLVELVFHKAGSSKIGGTIISVDKPCLLMYQMKEHIITVSDPSCKLDDIRVKFMINNSVQKSIPIELPQGADAGRSVSITTS
ncbi:MAG: hypothetical protein HKN87_04490 [Saprospiraceae bacterium]|nr:hypothetical protein [Saprospiraceae bacterium]